VGVEVLVFVGAIAGAGVDAAVGTVAAASLFGIETKIGTEALDAGVAGGWWGGIAELAACTATAGWAAEAPGEAGTACEIASKAAVLPVPRSAVTPLTGDAEEDETPSAPERERAGRVAAPAGERVDASADGALMAEAESGPLGAPCPDGGAPACSGAASAGFAACFAPSGMTAGGASKAAAVSEVASSAGGIAVSGSATGALRSPEEEEDEGLSAPEGKGAGGGISPGEERVVAPVGSAARAEE
jgi:hypothetical protein